MICIATWWDSHPLSANQTPSHPSHPIRTHIIVACCGIKIRLTEKFQKHFCLPSADVCGVSVPIPLLSPRGTPEWYKIFMVSLVSLNSNDGQIRWEIAPGQFVVRYMTVCWYHTVALWTDNIRIWIYIQYKKHIVLYSVHFRSIVNGIKLYNVICIFIKNNMMICPTRSHQNRPLFRRAVAAEITSWHRSLNPH